MNSIQRINLFTTGNKADRLPLYIPTISCSVASNILGRPADMGGESLHYKEGLAWLKGENAHDDFVEKHLNDTVEISSLLGVDLIRQTWRLTDRPSKLIDENTLLYGDPDGEHVVRRFFPASESYGEIYNSKQFGDVEQVERFLTNEISAGPHIESSCELDFKYQDHIKLHKLASNNFSVIGPGLGFFFLMTNPAWLEATAICPDLIRDYYLCKLESQLATLPWMVNNGFRWINGGVDIAMQTGSIISPNSFKTIFLEVLKELSRSCRDAGLIYCFRSDGNLWNLSDLIFKFGEVQAIGETDRGAGMEVGLLRKKYPELLILGNIDSRILHQASLDEVRSHVRAGLEESGGSHYCAGPSNAIMPGTPVDNVYAMVEEIHNFKIC